MEVHSHQVVIGAGRRIILPIEICRSLDLDIGDTVVLRVKDDKATLSSVEHSIERFQKLLADKVPRKTSLVDELIADRERSAADE